MMFKLIKCALPGLLLTATAAFAAEPAPKASTDAAPAVDTSAKPAADTPKQTADASKQAAPGKRPQSDRVTLDTTIVTGNRELPKVMSIVPWKSAEPPTGPDRPMGSLIEELLAPVDRDEFRREITYYDGLTSQSRSRDGQPAVSPARSVTSKQSSKPSGLSGASTQ